MLLFLHKRSCAHLFVSNILIWRLYWLLLEFFYFYHSFWLFFAMSACCSGYFIVVIFPYLNFLHIQLKLIRIEILNFLLFIAIFLELFNNINFPYRLSWVQYWNLAGFLKHIFGFLSRLTTRAHLIVNAKRNWIA